MDSARSDRWLLVDTKTGRIVRSAIHQDGKPRLCPSLKVLPDHQWKTPQQIPAADLLAYDQENGL